MSIFLLLGALSGFLSVAFGAFGAHVLETQLAPDSMETWQTGVTYLMLHALALVAIGILQIRFDDNKLLKASGSFMIIGILLFSGSLFLLSVTGIGRLGMITPFGGVCFLIGWLLLMVFAGSAHRNRSRYW